MAKSSGSNRRASPQRRKTKRAAPKREPKGKTLIEVFAAEEEKVAPTKKIPITESMALEVALEPSSGPQHTSIMITGTDFGAEPGTLYLNEVPAPIVLWTPLAIQTIVPYGASSGELVVTTSDGRRGA